VTDRGLRIAICVLAAAGAGIAGYLLYVHYSGGLLVCSTGGCETVQHSRYAKLAGIPVALLGLLAYIGIFATGLLRSELARAIGAALAVGGLVFALWLIYVQDRKIHAWCQWCLASDAILAVLAVLTVVRLLRVESDAAPVAAPAVAAPRRR
jgi:uncharacterized membrane protein